LPRALATTSTSLIGEGHVVIAATNAVDSPLEAKQFGREAIVCDLSVPPSVQPSTATARPDVVFIKGGIVSLPFAEDLQIASFPLNRGQAYACMAEAMLLGFEGIRDTSFTGTLTAQHLQRVTAMAERHGFTLAGYKRSCVLGSERREVLCASAG
jgi:predicted amino acid dehydrogenase